MHSVPIDRTYIFCSWENVETFTNVFFMIHKKVGVHIDNCKKTIETETPLGLD